MPTKARAAQLDRDIAEVLHRPRHARTHSSHHATRLADDGWLVARDAILERDPALAADIVNELRGTPGTPKSSVAFKKALHDAPSSVRVDFELGVPGWKSQIGKAEFHSNEPGEISLSVPGHGYFTAPVTVYNKYKKLSRKALLAKVLRIYEGIGVGNKGDKAAHWKGYDKDYLAIIVADAFKADDE